MAALRRIQKELINFEEEEHDEAFTAGPVDESDLYKWEASIAGPENSPYEGGIFYFSIEFPKNYPLGRPKVFSKTKIYHPNIRQDTGCFILDILKEWRPEIKVIDILKAIQNLLINPNIDHALEREVVKQYKEDKAAFDATAKQWTKEYAQYNNFI